MKVREREDNVYFMTNDLSTFEYKINWGENSPIILSRILTSDDTSDV